MFHQKLKSICNFFISRTMNKASGKEHKGKHGVAPTGKQRVHLVYPKDVRQREEAEEDALQHNWWIN